MTRVFLLIFTLIALSSVAQNNYNERPATQGLSTSELINEGVTEPEMLHLDSTYYSPVLISWFDKPAKFELSNRNNIYIDVAEITDLYSGSKTHRLHFFASFNSSISSSGKIKVFTSYEKGVSIVNALKCINKYIQEHLPTINQNIQYNINLSNNEQLAVELTYDPDDNKWKCLIEFSALSSTVTTSANYRTLPSNGFSIYGYLKNTPTDLPELINFLEKRLITLKERMEQEEEAERLIFTYTEDNNIICSYQGEDFPSGSTQLDSDTIFDLEGYAKDLNKRINKILAKEISDADNLGTYGRIDIVIGARGVILGKRLIISQDAFNRLNKRNIMRILNCISEEEKIKVINIFVGLRNENLLDHIILKAE